jgi:type IV pilus assembly protein PilX
MNGSCRRIPERRPPSRGERGAALVIGLILLLVLTILAVSGVMSSTLELRMVGNQQQQERAFQAAELAIEQAMTDAMLTETPQIQPVTTVPGSTDEYEYAIRKTGQTGAPPGFSLDAGFASHHFAVTASGYSSGGAESTHTQGFYVVGPGG